MDLVDNTDAISSQRCGHLFPPIECPYKYCGYRETLKENDRLRNALLTLCEVDGKRLEHLRGAMAAQDARNLAATERLGLQPADCDTPDYLADEIESLRNDRDGAKYALGLASATIEHLKAFQANASHAHRLEIAELMAEQEHLRRQRDQLHAANNAALVDKRLAVEAGDYCLAKWGRDFKSRGRKLLEESAELMVKLSDEWEIKQHGTRATLEEIGDVQITLWSIARLLEADATECAREKFGLVVEKYGPVAKP